MPITFSPTETELSSVSVIEDFTKTISASTDEAGDSIVSVTVTTSNSNSGVILTNGVTSCTIAGNYVSPFTNTAFTWITNGAISSTQNYVNVPSSIGNMIRYQPDDTVSEIFSYTVTATSDLGSTLSITYTIECMNDWSEGQEQIQNVITRQSKSLQIGT